jgi:hypothetical protein
MSRTTLLAVVLAACALAPFTASAQVDVAGVKYETSTELQGSKVQLNGAGIRYFGPFKVYAAGLYLGKKAATPEEALAQPGAKRISVTMLRDIDAGELGKLFTRSVEDNMEKGSFVKLIPGLLRMSEIFSRFNKLKAGDSFTLDWIPGRGTVVSVRGVTQSESFKEPEFYQALMRIWLGPVPVDWKLKERLLGKPA